MPILKKLNFSSYLVSEEGLRWLSEKRSGAICVSKALVWTSLGTLWGGMEVILSWLSRPQRFVSSWNHSRSSHPVHPWPRWGEAGVLVSTRREGQLFKYLAFPTSQFPRTPHFLVSLWSQLLIMVWDPIFALIQDEIKVLGINICITATWNRRHGTQNRVLGSNINFLGAKIEIERPKMHFGTQHRPFMTQSKSETIP